MKKLIGPGLINQKARKIKNKKRMVSSTIHMIIGIIVIISYVLIIILTPYQKYFTNPERLVVKDKESHRNIINYLNGKEELKISLKPEEKEHLAEVKERYDEGRKILMASIIVFLITSFIERKRVAEIMRKSNITAALIIALMIIAGLFFEHSFIIFHEMLFKSQWMFTPDHTLIRIYSEESFRNALINSIREDVMAIIMSMIIVKLYRDSHPSQHLHR